MLGERRPEDWRVRFWGLLGIPTRDFLWQDLLVIVFTFIAWAKGIAGMAQVMSKGPCAEVMPLGQGGDLQKRVEPLGQLLNIAAGSVVNSNFTTLDSSWFTCASCALSKPAKIQRVELRMYRRTRTSSGLGMWIVLTPDTHEKIIGEVLDSLDRTG